MRLLTDEQWARLAPCLPHDTAKVGRRFADHRRIIEGIIYRSLPGIPWRDLPREAFGLADGDAQAAPTPRPRRRR